MVEGLRSSFILLWALLHVTRTLGKSKSAAVLVERRNKRMKCLEERSSDPEKSSSRFLLQSSSLPISKGSKSGSSSSKSKSSMSWKSDSSTSTLFPAADRSNRVRAASVKERAPGWRTVTVFQELDVGRVQVAVPLKQLFTWGRRAMPFTFEQGVLQQRNGAGSWSSCCSDWPPSWNHGGVSWSNDGLEDFKAEGTSHRSVCLCCSAPPPSAFFSSAHSSPGQTLLSMPGSFRWWPPSPGTPPAENTTVVPLWSRGSVVSSHPPSLPPPLLFLSVVSLPLSCFSSNQQSHWAFPEQLSPRWRSSPFPGFLLPAHVQTCTSVRDGDPNRSGDHSFITQLINTIRIQESDSSGWNVHISFISQKKFSQKGGGIKQMFH